MSGDFKVVDIGDTGTAQRYGADDLAKIARILNGENLSADILITNEWRMAHNKLILRDFSDEYDIRIGTSEETANWSITIPVLGGNRVPVFTDLAQTLSNKTIAGLRRAISTQTDTPLDLDTNYEIVLIDATAGSKIVNLPEASESEGLLYIIQKIDSSANTVTIDPDSSETLNDASTLVLSTQYESVMVYCEGNEWFSITHNHDSDYADISHDHAGADITSGTVAATYLPDASTSAKGIIEVATDGEIGSDKAVVGSDSRLNNQSFPELIRRTPNRMIGYVWPIAINGFGILGFTTGTGGGGTNIDNTYGVSRAFETGATPDTVAGRRGNDTVFRRIFKPYILIYFRNNDATNEFTMFHGLTASNDFSALDHTNVLNTQAGIGLCVRPGDTNFQFVRNDGSSTATYTDSGQVKDTDLHFVEIWSDNVDWFVALDGDSPVTLSTDSPAETTALLWSSGIKNQDSVDHHAYLHYVASKIDIP